MHTGRVQDVFEVGDVKRGPGGLTFSVMFEATIRLAQSVVEGLVPITHDHVSS